MLSTPKLLFVGELSGLAPLVEASAKAGHMTYVLVRNSSHANQSNFSMIRQFELWGAHIVYGKLSDHRSLVKAIKKAEVVISLESTEADKNQIISAIKQAGNHKEFITLRPANDANLGVVSANRAYPPYRPPAYQVPPTNFNPYYPPPPYQQYPQPPYQPYPPATAYPSPQPAAFADHSYPPYPPPAYQVPSTNFNPYYPPPPNQQNPQPPYWPYPPTTAYPPPPPAPFPGHPQHNTSLAEKLLRAIAVSGYIFDIFQCIEG